jgi:hypothetical protein
MQGSVTGSLETKRKEYSFLARDYQSNLIHRHYFNYAIAQSEVDVFLLFMPSPQ